MKNRRKSGMETGRERKAVRQRHDIRTTRIYEKIKSANDGIKYCRQSRQCHFCSFINIVLYFYYLCCLFSLRGCVRARVGILSGAVHINQWAIALQLLRFRHSRGRHAVSSPIKASGRFDRIRCRTFWKKIQHIRADTFHLVWSMAGTQKFPQNPIYVYTRNGSQFIPFASNKYKGWILRGANYQHVLYQMLSVWNSRQFWLTIRTKRADAETFRIAFRFVQKAGNICAARFNFIGFHCEWLNGAETIEFRTLQRSQVVWVKWFNRWNSSLAFTSAFSFGFCYLPFWFHQSVRKRKSFTLIGNKKRERKNGLGRNRNYTTQKQTPPSGMVNIESENTSIRFDYRKWYGTRNVNDLIWCWADRDWW